MTNELSQDEINALFDCSSEELEQILEKASQVSEPNFTEEETAPQVGISSYVEPSESWKMAQALFSSVHLSSNYLIRTRGIFLLQETDPNKRRALALALTFPYLIRVSESYHAIFYRYVEQLHPTKFQELGDGDILDFLSSIEPEEIAVVLALSLLFSQVRRIIEDEENKEFFRVRVRQSILLGYGIAYCTDFVPPAVGGLLGGVLACSQALLLLKDKKAFSRYRARLQKNNVFTNITEEREFAGTSHSQIAALFLQSFGLSKAGVGVALADAAPHEDPSIEVWQKTYFIFRYLWNSQGEFPKHLNVSKSICDKIRESYLKIQGGDIFRSDWLEYRGKDLDRDTMRRLVLEERYMSKG